MNRRFRLPAALLALLALSANFADGAGASPCPPEMEPHAAAVAPDTENAAAHAHHTTAPEPDAGGPLAPHSDAPACPQGMAGSGSTCISASLPVPAATVTPGRLDRTPALAFLDDTHDRLVVAGHFRPPQA